MSRRRSRGDGRGGRPGGGRTRRLAIAGALAAALLAAALWLGRPGGGRGPAPERLSDAALFDSLRRAYEEKRPADVLRWAERRRALAPRRPMIMVGHAMALHDYAWSVAPAGRPRTALRTSLERVALDLGAIALFDSALKAATEPAERAWAGRLLGMAFETWGLPADALLLYDAAARDAGRDSLLAARLGYVSRALRDPGYEPGARPPETALPPPRAGP